jgi:PKD repeat protein
MSNEGLLQRLLILSLIVALAFGFFENASASTGFLWTQSASETKILSLAFPHRDVTPPVANAGPDQSVDEDVQVQFDGSGSTDNIGIRSYVWTFVDGTPKTLSGIAPTYTFLNPGNYTVMLKVSDAAGNWATDMVALTIRDITPPIIGTVSQSPSVDVDEGQLVKISANITDVGTGVKNATLIYSNDNGSSWKTPLPMIYNSTTSSYETTILGHISGTLVKYKITAYDNAGNLMTENNAGQYYSYQVIPELPTTYLILLFILTTTLVVTTYKKSKAQAPSARYRTWILR